MTFAKKEKAIISFIIIVEIIWVAFLIHFTTTRGKEFMINHNILNVQNKPLPDGTIINYEGYCYKVYSIERVK